MRKKLLGAVAIVAVTASMAAVVYAQDKSSESKSAPAVSVTKPAPVKRASVDSNEDGKVSLDEAKASADLQFANFDKSKDEKVSLDEFLAHMTLVGPKGKKPSEEQIKQAQKMMKGRFAELDSDKSKTLTKAELEADSLARHKMMDTDQDGFVSQDEVMAFRKKSMEARAEKLKEMKAQAAEKAKTQ
ncbi:MAG: hypothetical protein JNN09_07820 [Alphaproteobacteria bacterium]|nr:hypothetical protein [Alphaproteobacteria bacterium]